LKTEIGTLDNRGTTPNFIREKFRENIMELRVKLLQMAEGLMELPEITREAVEKGDIPGALLIEGKPYQVVPVSLRHDSIKTVIQTGVGYRSDHTTDDEPLRRQVVIMGPWDDERPELNAPAKGALTDGKPAADDTTTRRRADGNGNGRRRAPG
jgi:hypothetical protein